MSVQSSPRATIFAALFAAKAACRRVIAVSILLLLSARKCSIEENVKQTSTSGLERLYVN